MPLCDIACLMRVLYTKPFNGHNETGIDKKCLVPGPNKGNNGQAQKKGM
jgi:hypothetical protein